MPNIFSQGSIYDQQKIIFECTSRWSEFENFPDVCIAAYGSSKDKLFDDLISAYHGECQAIKESIIKGLSVLYLFHRVERKKLIQLITKANERKLSMIESELLDRFERIIMKI